MHERWLHFCPKGLMYHCSSVPCSVWSSIAPPFHYFVFCSILLSVEDSDDNEIKRALIGVYQVRVYHTAGNFRGRKLSRIGEKYNFREKTLWISCFAIPKDATCPNFAENTFTNSHKTAKFVKVFFLESFPLYGIQKPTTWYLVINMQHQKMFPNITVYCMMNMLLVAHAMNYSSQIASDATVLFKRKPLWNVQVATPLAAPKSFCQPSYVLHYNIRLKYLELPSGVESTSGTSEPL